MRVTFIVPVYKVEQYLSQCIESILFQSYTDFEIILVDDGSPDASGEICDKYALQDGRVSVVHKENGGLSDARNVGLLHAKGDYVIFIDSDDFWMESKALERLMKIVDANSNCDFIGFNCSYYYGDNELYVRWVPYSENITSPIDKNIAIHSLVLSGTMPMSACLKVISRKFLLDMHISFIKGILAEDIPWFIDLLDRSNYCMFVNEYIYVYRQNRKGSITNSGGEKSFNNLLCLIQQELEKVEHRTFSEEAKNDLYSFFAYEFCILLGSLNSFSPDKRSERRRELLKCKWLLKYTVNPKVKKVALVNKFVGIRATEWLLGFYLRKMRK